MRFLINFFDNFEKLFRDYRKTFSRLSKNFFEIMEKLFRDNRKTFWDKWKKFEKKFFKKKGSKNFPKTFRRPPFKLFQKHPFSKFTINFFEIFFRSSAAAIRSADSALVTNRVTKGIAGPLGSVRQETTYHSMRAWCLPTRLVTFLYHLKLSQPFIFFSNLQRV